jgi:hypothetical protein
MSDDTARDGNAEGIARVARTGIALVHEGELVVPAPSSEAFLEGLRSDEERIVYHFPVEIEVRAAGEVDVESIIEATLSRLAARLDGR